ADRRACCRQTGFDRSCSFRDRPVRKRRCLTMSNAPLRREPLVASGMPPGSELLARGRKLAKTVSCGRSLFLDHHGVASEAIYKRAAAAQGRIMQHAQIGFRDATRTVEAMKQIVDSCARRGVTVDRFGIALDWSMGYPLDTRAARSRGTGI